MDKKRRLPGDVDTGETDLVKAIEQLGVHDHLCLIYETQEEQFAAVIPFMKIGLARGEKCVYIVDDNTAAKVINGMKATGMDVETAVESGKLTIVSKQDAYLKQGYFDPDWMIGFLKNALDEAKAAGFSALRATGEMTWMLGGEPGTERLIEYEAKLNYFLPENDILAICQYNRKRFSTEILKGVISTHPLIIYGGMVCRNFYYIPPDDFLGGEQSGKEIDRLLANIKDREKAEKSLWEREARYRGLFEASPISLWEEDFSEIKQHIDDLRASGVSDFRAYFEEHPEEVARCVRATKIIDVNQATLNMFKSDSKELLLEGLSAIFSQESFDVFKEELITFAGGDTQFQSEAVLENLADDKLYTIVSLSIAPGYEDTWGKVFVSVSDITERKQLEEAFRAQSRYSEAFFNHSITPLAFLDRDFNFIRVNKVYADADEKDQSYFPGRNHFELYPSDAKAIFEEVVRTKTAFQAVDHPFIYADHPDRGVTYWDWILVPILDKNGEVEFLVFSLVIVTERRQREEEKKKLEDQLRHAQKMEAIGTLAGGVAHDFNNILNVIIGYGTMLQDRMGDDPLSKEQLNEVLAAADRAANLTKRLLVFSRKQVMEVKPVNVNEGIINMEKMLSRIIGEDIAFSMELTSRKMIVMADSGQLEQVLMNLVTNARYAMPKGGKLTISTGTKEMDEEYITAYGYGKAGTYALISVADTGSGMDAETQKKVFEPFFTTKCIGEGTGLGLSIVYGIVKQHNGYVNVYSEPGKGSEFKIYLPLIEEETAKGQEVEVVAPGKGGTETILLAEDDASLRKLSRIVLESFGYTVITAEDGEEAITRYIENKDKIHLVVLDMIMPKKNGKEVYEEIRKINPKVRALFVSGYTMDIIHQKELLDEGMDFILKPVSPKDLVKKVREALDR